MKKKMYVFLTVPVVAALIAGIAFYAFYTASFGGTAIAASEQPAQLNNQALEQEGDDVAGEIDDEDGAEDEVEESEDPSLADQAKITADEAVNIAANHVSVLPSTVKSIELEKEGSLLIYSIEFAKLEVEINAVTGNVVSVENEDD